MKFHEAKAEEWETVKLLSETGLWELTLYPVLYGVRVRLRRSHDVFYITDYCGGDNALWQMFLLQTVRVIAESMPESCTHNEMQALFPEQEFKPIWNDPELRDYLAAKAQLLKAV